MAAANHSFYLRNCYLENNLSHGKMEIAGRTLSLSDITIPVYNLCAKEDHIAPARSVFYGSQFFGGDVEFVMAGSGHIAGVVNPPSLKKYQYWTGGKPTGEFSKWLENATEHPGSWWPHWHLWIKRQDDREAPARKPGESALGEAPGSYVKVRV
jgi:polyhydroxyalkanoate synthase